MYFNRLYCFIPFRFVQCTHISLAKLNSCLFKHFQSGADQFLSDRRGADFPRGVHLCATKGAAWAVVFLATLS